MNRIQSVYILLFILLTFGAMGCEEMVRKEVPIDPTLAEAGPLMHLTGNMISGEPIQLIITKSAPIFGQVEGAYESDMFQVEEATVQVYVGDELKEEQKLNIATNDSQSLSKLELYNLGFHHYRDIDHFLYFSSTTYIPQPGDEVRIVVSTPGLPSVQVMEKMPDRPEAEVDIHVVDRNDKDLFLLKRQLSSVSDYLEDNYIEATIQILGNHSEEQLYSFGVSNMRPEPASLDELLTEEALQSLTPKERSDLYYRTEYLRFATWQFFISEQLMLIDENAHVSETAKRVTYQLIQIAGQYSGGPRLNTHYGRYFLPFTTGKEPTNVLLPRFRKSEYPEELPINRDRDLYIYRLSPRSAILASKGYGRLDTSILVKEQLEQDFDLNFAEFMREKETHLSNVEGGMGFVFTATPLIIQDIDR